MEGEGHGTTNRNSEVCRFEITGRVAYGWWRDGAIEELKGSIYGAATPTGRTFRSEQVRLLVPCEPSKVVAVGLN